MDKVLCTVILVYLLLKKKGGGTSSASFWEKDKQEQVCKTRATATTSILGWGFLLFFRRKAYVWKPMAGLLNGVMK